MAGVPPSRIKIEYPAELKNTHWQKAKGKVGKLIKTGLCVELKKLEAMIKIIDVAALDPARKPSKTMNELAKKVVTAKKEYAHKVEPVYKQLSVVRDVADITEQKMKTIPMGVNAGKAAAAVGKAATRYAVICKTLDMNGSIETAKADIRKKSGVAAL